jgi:hypothetical protein
MRAPQHPSESTLLHCTAKTSLSQFHLLLLSVNLLIWGKETCDMVFLLNYHIPTGATLQLTFPVDANIVANNEVDLNTMDIPNVSPPGRSPLLPMPCGFTSRVSQGKSAPTGVTFGAS